MVYTCLSFCSQRGGTLAPGIIPAANISPWAISPSTPPNHKSGPYASYWYAFLFKVNFNKETTHYLLFPGFISYLRQVHHVYMPPDHNWHCKIGHTVLFTSTFCSTFFILSMTFDRFYSIIMPHKAASFNTVKRAKVTVMCIILFSILYHIPHMFIKSTVSSQCVPYSGAITTDYGKFYYWFTYAISYILLFVLLLIMNSVIIHTLRQRVNWTKKSSEV